jgi:hypothetical protein
MTLHHRCIRIGNICVRGSLVVFITAICMISVQYASIRPINWPVNHEIHVLLLLTHVYVSQGYVRVEENTPAAINRVIASEIYKLSNCTKISCDTGTFSQINYCYLHASSVQLVDCVIQYEQNTSVHNIIIHIIIDNIVHYIIIKCVLHNSRTFFHVTHTDVPGVCKFHRTIICRRYSCMELIMKWLLLPTAFLF